MVVYQTNNFCNGKYYMLITTIGINDALYNGTVEKLVHLDFADNVCRVWLEFCDSEKIGQKIRKAVHLRCRIMSVIEQYPLNYERQTFY